MRGKVVTVLGPIEPEILGVTLTHEHLLVDLRVWCEEPEEEEKNETMQTEEEEEEKNERLNDSIVRLSTIPVKTDYVS